MRQSIVTCFAAFATAGLIVGPAGAEEVSVAVSFEDLDLSAPKGVATLERRIEAAIGKVCEKPGLRELKAAAAWEECKASARAGALEQLSVLEPYQAFALAGGA